MNCLASLCVAYSCVHIPLFSMLKHNIGQFGGSQLWGVLTPGSVFRYHSWQCSEVHRKQQSSTLHFILSSTVHFIVVCVCVPFILFYFFLLIALTTDNTSSIFIFSKCIFYYWCSVISYELYAQIIEVHKNVLELLLGLNLKVRLWKHTFVIVNIAICEHVFTLIWVSIIYLSESFILSLKKSRYTFQI